MSEQHTITTVGTTQLGVEPGDKIEISGTATQEAKENSARVVQLIETRLRRRGAGTDDDPTRNVREYWSLDGNRVAEHDPKWPAPHDSIKSLQAAVASSQRTADYKTELNKSLREQLDKANVELEKKDAEVRHLKAKLLDATRAERSAKYQARKKAKTTKAKTRRKKT